MAGNNFAATDDSHRRFWNSFVRFATYATTTIVVILALMALLLI